MRHATAIGCSCDHKSIAGACCSGVLQPVLILAAFSSTCLLEKLKAGKRCIYVIQAVGVCRNIVKNGALVGLLPARSQHDFMRCSHVTQEWCRHRAPTKSTQGLAAKELFPAQWNRMHSLLGSSLKAGVIAMDNLMVRSPAHLRRP
jgi:hypothetical protein